MTSRAKTDNAKLKRKVKLTGGNQSSPLSKENQIITDMMPETFESLNVTNDKNKLKINYLHFHVI